MPSKKFYRRGAQIISTATALSSAASPNILTNADDGLASNLMYYLTKYIAWIFFKSFFENRIEKYFSKCKIKTGAEWQMYHRGDTYKEIAQETSPGKRAGFRLLEGKDGQQREICYFLEDTGSLLGDSISNAGDWQNNYDDNTRLFNSIQNFNFMTKYLEHFKKLGLKFIPINRECIMFSLYDQGITVDFRGEKLGINNINFNFGTYLGPNLNIIGRKKLADNSPQTIIDYSLKGEKGEKKLTIKEMQDLLNSITEKIEENQYPLNEKHKFANADLDINALKSLE